jgi:NitT/TauT family transport system substrate-binding protein
MRRTDLPSTHKKNNMHKHIRSVRLLAALLAASVAFALPARAEGQLRIAQQFGIVYLLLNVAQDQKLIEKQGAKAGVPISVEWVQLSGGNTVNDALLSGAIDVAAAGVGPLLTIWDRTAGRQNVRGVASLGNFPYYLVTTNPNVKSIADFTEKDRIALPAVGVSVQARILQFAAAKQWGAAQANRLDHLTQAIPHPDAAAAIIAGKTEIDAHFGNPPFQEQELAGNPKAHVVLDSYDVLGGPSSSTVLYATEKFVTQNPKTYRAFIDALAEAARIITTNPELAADAYLRVTHAKIDRAFLVKTIRNPQFQFKVTPQNTLVLAQFLQQIGAIKKRPASWKDYFFADPALGAGG